MQGTVWHSVLRRLVQRPPPPARTRFWQSERIRRHVNARVSGRPVSGPGEGDRACLEREFPGRRFRRAVSVACGHGLKEMTLVRAGLVEAFDLFEASPARVAQGRRRAREWGLAQRVRFLAGDPVEVTAPGHYDLVYWSNALHHMLDVHEAVRWSRRALAPGGVFYLNDYVGPNRMQWTARTLEMASRARELLPERCLRDPHRSGRRLPSRVSRPAPEALALADPTECADSERILPALRELFPEARVFPIGGTVYHLALNDVLANLDEVEDAALLDLLLALDDACTALGEWHYAVAVARNVGEAWACRAAPRPFGLSRLPRTRRWRRVRVRAARRIRALSRRP